ncbi:MAG: universal stress protein [Halobacteriales archaeon]
MASPEADTVLVPVDGSDESERAAEYAVALAAEYDAALHAMYVLGEAAARAIDAGALDPEDAAAEGRAVLGSIGDSAAAEGLPFAHSTAYGFSTSRKTVHPGSVILDAADQLAADLLVIPRESAREGSADVLEKAAEYVLLYASQPVLSV